MRKKAQEKALQKMKRELRSKMEREIGELQKIIIQNDDDDYFWGPGGREAAGEKSKWPPSSTAPATCPEPRAPNPPPSGTFRC
uniref:Uncharacterized protein n=1 Tax=Anguilla anguilla TaxID=7936 RepID=A0A0E9TWH6_ANGAN